MKNLEVRVATDLTIFKQVEGNRPVNALHIDKLVRSIQDYGMLVSPILVNKTMLVVDGQHRLAAAKKANSYIYYIVVEDYGIEQVHALNLTQKKWTNKDFLNSYVEMGLDDYILLKNFTKLNDDFSLDVCTMLCSNKRDYSGPFNKLFRSGNWKIGELTAANKLAGMLRAVGEYYDGYNRRVFVSTMIMLINKDVFDFESFLTKLSRNPSLLTNCTNTSQYVSLIEDIYNYKRRNKVNLRY